MGGAEPRGCLGWRAGGRACPVRCPQAAGWAGSSRAEALPAAAGTAVVARSAVAAGPGGGIAESGRMARRGEGRVAVMSDPGMSGTGVVVAGRYRLDGRIAAGAMGEVWRGVDTMLDRPVAVKLLRAEHARHGEILSRFRAEARHAGSLSHPGIVAVYDFGEEGPGHSPYLVMELVLGRSLARVVAFGPMDPARAMDVVAQTAAGLDAAHSAGLVHSDVKPANLLLGPGGQVKITDFGIARRDAGGGRRHRDADRPPRLPRPGTARRRPLDPGPRPVLAGEPCP